MPERTDIGYFVTHPCHPSIFSDEPDEEARKGRFGGIAAPRSIVNALMSGDDAFYARGDEGAIIWGPVLRSHRLSVEHSETLAAVTFGHIPGVFSDACNKAVENGKPRLMRDDWKGIFDPVELTESIRRIT